MTKNKNINEMEQVPYGNTGTLAYTDGYYYYNENGQQLKDPVEYESNCEGYTPFGDE